MFIKWVPEITHHCQKTPFLLVGTQIDLREDATTVEKLAKNKQKSISFEQGEKLAKELKAVKYVECSALTQVSITIFTVVIYHKFRKFFQKLPGVPCISTVFIRRQHDYLLLTFNRCLSCFILKHLLNISS